MIPTCPLFTNAISPLLNMLKLSYLYLFGSLSDLSLILLSFSLSINDFKFLLTKGEICGSGNFILSKLSKKYMNKYIIIIGYTKLNKFFIKFLLTYTNLIFIIGNII